MKPGRHLCDAARDRTVTSAAAGLGRLPGQGLGRAPGKRRSSPAQPRVVHIMPYGSRAESGRMHRKAEEEAAIGANGDDDNAARRRLGPSDAA